MAHTARTASERKEYFDSPEVLEQKVDQLAAWVRDSKHCIAFAGAGVSTAAGIPDFRSGINTSLSTGPGKWELQAHKKSRSSKCKVTSTLKAMPTATHMAFVKLQQEGILKCVVSQNTDGLHRRSGLPRIALCELHGNTNLEVCNKCGREYLRDYRTRTSKRVHVHFTGQRCDNPACNGQLKDTIINFGEDLPEGEFEKGNTEVEVADLCIAMGSSLTVTPAADLPERVAERGQRLVIVNLQKTPLDELASLCINGKCDDVIKLLMAKLRLDIPEFRLRRQLVMKCSRPAHLKSTVVIEGRDSEGHIFSFIKEVEVVSVGGRKSSQPNLDGKDGFTFSVSWSGAAADVDELVVNVRVHTHGHYGEPPLECGITANRRKAIEVQQLIEYNLFTKEWTTSPLAPSPLPQSPSPPSPPHSLTEQLATVTLS